MVRDSSPPPETRLTGRWRIVEMSGSDRDAIDLLGPGFVEFAADGTGELGCIAVEGRIDHRPVVRDDRAGVEFTFEGVDEGDPVSGPGWATLVDDRIVEGHLFFHLGDESTFRAEPVTPVDRADGPA